MQRISWFSCLCVLGLTFLLSGCASNSKKDYPATVARFLIEARGDDAGINIQLPVSGVVIRVSPKAMITEYDIVSAQLVQTDLGPCVMFQLTQEAGRALFRISATNQGSRLITTINGRALGARLMERPIGDALIISYLELPASGLPELVDNINKTAVDLQKELAKKKK